MVNAFCSMEDWKYIAARGPCFENDCQSFSSMFTTIPEFAKGLFRFEGDQPFTTSSPSFGGCRCYDASRTHAE